MPDKAVIREFKTIRKETRALLARAEGRDVEFKREAKAVEQSDLVAFANSEAGGTILVGVDEFTSAHGVQRGRVVGCAVGDRERLLVADRASKCHTSIDLSICVENAGSKPILRIDVPSGPHKPYCTSRGTYRIRGEGQNQPLLPPQLLSLVMETQAQEFLQRFAEATSGLETHLKEINSNAWAGFCQLDEGVKNLTGTLRQRMNEISDELNRSFEEVFAVAENASGLADDSMMQASVAADGVDVANEQLQALMRQVGDVNEGLRAMMSAMGIEDPARVRLETTAKQLLADIIEQEPSISLDAAASRVMQIMELPIGGFVHEIARREFGSRDRRE